MTLLVLKNKTEITNARKVMLRLGIDCADGPIKSFLKNLHLLPGPLFGDRIKSWDVLRTSEFLLEWLRKDAPVLDIGTYSSEILPALSRKGFTHLTGVDLNPNIKKMPDANRINYQVGDFYGGALASESFSAITAISVIEHGFECNRLLAEISRLLCPGGYFIASIDYWPDKIDTNGIRVFGLDWMIFSQADIKHFLNEAIHFGLVPVGDLDFSAEDPIIAWQGKKYTFAWIVLRKESRDL